MMVLGMLTSPAQVAAEAISERNILVMGDSLAAEYGLPRDTGCVKLLDREVNKPGENTVGPIIFHNASISGETTSGGVKRLPEQLTQHKPYLVIIELGANDALRGLSLTATRDNLRTMIKAAQASGAKVLLLGMQIPPNYGSDYTRKFKLLFQELGQETGCTTIGFFLEAIAANKDMFQADGLHPTVAAQPLLMQTVYAVLAPMITSVHPARQK